MSRWLDDRMPTVEVNNPPPWYALTLDMNADGQFTLGDGGSLLVHLFFLPGDSLLWVLFTFSPGLVRFFELSHSAFGGVESAVLSTVGWLFAILTLGAIYSMLMQLNWIITAYVAGAYQELLRRTRVGKILLAYRLRRWTGRTQPQLTQVSDSHEVDLDDRDLEVLSLHRASHGESALGTREIAARMGVSAREAQRTIDKLKKLELLANRMDEKGSYQLTRPGEMFLLSRNLLPT